MLPLAEIRDAYLKLMKEAGTDWEAEKKLMAEDMGLSYDELLTKSGRAGPTCTISGFHMDGKMEGTRGS